MTSVRVGITPSPRDRPSDFLLVYLLAQDRRNKSAFCPLWVQNAKNSLGANVFRSSSKNGHHQLRLQLQKFAGCRGDMLRKLGVVSRRTLMPLPSWSACPRGGFIGFGHASPENELIEFVQGSFPPSCAKSFGQRGLVENAIQGL